MPNQVRCADCGFVALRNTDTRQLVEIEAAIRESGNIPSIMVPRIGQQHIYEFGPICCVRAFPLLEESRNESGGSHEQLRRTLDKSRECNRFTPWQQGFTPKEHSEMMQEVELCRWQADREDADHKWREDQAEREHQWRIDDADRSQTALKQAQRNHLIDLIVMGVIVTVVSVAAQIAAAFIERGSLFPDQPTVRGQPKP